MVEEKEPDDRAGSRSPPRPHPPPLLLQPPSSPPSSSIPPLLPPPKPLGGLMAEPRLLGLAAAVSSMCRELARAAGSIRRGLHRLAGLVGECGSDSLKPASTPHPAAAATAMRSRLAEP